MKRRYDLLYAMGALVSSPILAIGLLKTGKWRTDWRGRFGKTPPLPRDSRPTLLLHGVSVGEINATRALVDHLTATDSSPIRIVVSSTTNTGIDRAKELYGDRLDVVQFPFDFSWMVSRFFDAVRPDAVALMELEVWPNLTQVCGARGVPLSVINGRLSENSFKHYRWSRPFVRSMFRALAAVGAQTELYAQRFRSLGTPPDRITVTDTMKWDTVTLVDEVEGAQVLRDSMGIDPSKPLVVAGSTGPGEEELLLAGKSEGVQLLLVPRKPERFDEVARLTPGMVRRSERPDGATPPPGGGEVFLLDTMGELTKAFSLADVAVVGRSFVPLGGSDPIEAIALGKATLMGPHFANFKDVVEGFETAGGIRITDRPMEVAEDLLKSPDSRKAMGEKGREVIRLRKGATGKNAGIVHDLLERCAAGEFAPKAPGGRIRRWLTLALLLYLMAGYVSTAFSRVTVLEMAAPDMPLPTQEGELWSGVFSVHTDRSHDARGTRDAVAAAAASAGLDFVVIGDHPPDDRKPGWEFWEPAFLGGVFLEGGQELRSPQAGKILAVGVDTTYKQWQGDYTSFAEMLAEEGATAFVVHGRGPRGSERWVNPDARGVQGWEVLDISEFARHRLTGPWSLYHLLTLAVGTPLGLGDEALLHLMREGFETPTVAAYDSLRANGSLTATAGLNSHPKVELGPVLIPGYTSAFRTLVSHVSVPGASVRDPGLASAALMAGARRGNVFVSAGRREAARSFRMAALAPGGSFGAAMGGATQYGEGVILRAGFEEDPERKLLYRIVMDGEAVAWTLGPELEWRAPGPGLYRVEVYSYSARIGDTIFRLRPWIFGNPILLSRGDSGSTP
jgi:3-deoxy-D-manno-octulosonic-acid transferase